MTMKARLLIRFLCIPLAAARLAHGQAPGLETLSRIDLLPTFKTSVQVGSISSYDRSGGNDDGFSGKYSFIRKEGDALVLADLEGPGVIYRIWTPTPTDDLMEFVLDGEARPRVQVPFREMFLGKHPLFPAPLTGFGAGGYFSYVPIPFARSCVVRLRANKAQFYQINYALYAPDTALASWDPETAAKTQARAGAIDLWQRAGEDLSRWSAPPEAAVQAAVRSVTLAGQSTQTIFQAETGGRIVGLRISPASAVAGKLRDVLLRIAFDGERPAVLCPLGDFFGYAWGQPAMQALLAGTVGETNYCYFPMPFRRSARVELISERAGPVELRAEILHAAAPRLPAEGGFRAVWRRENPTRIGAPYTLLESKGRGHLVGVVLQSQGLESGKTLFFEGDDETTLDGQVVIRGTGSEDFFNGGWYDVPDRWEQQISFPLSGCLGYAKHLGRTGGYRLFLGDAYSYRAGILQTIEHAGENNSIPTDYCSVAYYYEEGEPAEVQPLPPLAQRAVTDLEEILFPAWWQLPLHAWSFDRASLTRKREKIGGEEIRFLSFSAAGQDWFGPHFVQPVCDIPAAGPYAIYLEVVRGPAQARVQLFQNENPVAPPVDLFAPEPVKSERLLLGRLPLVEGRNRLMLKLVDKNERSSGLGLDLISVVCVRER